MQFVVVYGIILYQTFIVMAPMNGIYDNVYDDYIHVCMNSIISQLNSVLYMYIGIIIDIITTVLFEANYRPFRYECIIFVKR